MNRSKVMRMGLGVAFVCVMLAGIILQSVSERRVVQANGASGGNGEVYLPVVMNPLPPIIPDTTIVLTEETTQHLVSVSSDGATFTFAQMTPELAALSPGDIIVGEPVASAPYGFLRGVTNVTTSSQQVMVETEAATLEEAIQQGEVHLSRVLTPEDVQDSLLLPGASMLEFAPDEFYLQLNDVVLYDEDGNHNTTNDQITANGSITLDPSFDFDMRIRDWQLEWLRFTTGAAETANLNIGATVSYPLANEEVEIARYYFSPIIIQVGILPVVFTPVLVVSVGVDGSVHVGVSTGVTQGATLTAGLEYEQGNWEPIHTFDNNFQYIPPTLSAGLDLKGYAAAELSLMLYGVVGPHLGIEAYLKLEADPLANPWWELYGGLAVPAGVKIEIFSYVVAGYETTLIDYQVPLAQADSPSDNGTTIRVSVSSDGTQGNSFSVFPYVSGDGRYVAFTSYATNLVESDSNNGPDVFIYDQQTGQTSLVSASSNGTQGNSGSSTSSISADGRYVAFTSFATNLVSGDTNGDWDIFVHDRQTGQTNRVSIASDGTQGNNDSNSASISANGRYVAFDSLASNLVISDTNDVSDIFVYDQQTGLTSRVSIASDGAQGNLQSASPSISADGRYVAFYSYANNLVSSDTNNDADIFVHDLQTNSTMRVSIASDGTQGNNNSDSPSISANGRYVAFYSHADNLVNNDNNGVEDIFVHDRQTGETNRVSVASDGTQGNGVSDFPVISSDGRYVAFTSFATNLVSGDTNYLEDVFIHNRQTGQTYRVSVASDGTQGNSGSWFPAISADGRYVAFNSDASNLIPSDTNGYSDVFVHDRGE